MRYAVILAGGSGTRLWPASRRARPKQLLPLGPGGEALIAGAVRRGRMVADHVIVVTAAEQAAATRVVLGAGAGAGDRAPVRILEEPVGRNTAAAIALAAASVPADATLIVLPADQHVADEAGLAGAIGALCEAAAAHDSIGLVGITPTRAETGFGYLEVAPGEGAVAGVREVVRFVEKPDAETAARYVAAGTYLWNAGMFVATARRLLAELDARLPQTAAAARAIAAGGDAAALYGPLPRISIDHAVMEAAGNVVAVPASVGWNDVGSWAALPDVRGADERGNTVEGRVVMVDARGSIAMSDDPSMVVALVGVEDLVVVKSGNAVLVMRKSAAQDVRQVVEELQRQGAAAEELL